MFVKICHSAATEGISFLCGFEAEGREFESLRARHSKTYPHIGLRYFR